MSSGFDTAKDPLAGMDDMEPMEIVSSMMFKKGPMSEMFMELFRYIAGVNQVGLLDVLDLK